MRTTITDLDDFKALDPFFRIIEKGLDGIADGGHFFDLLAEDVIFDLGFRRFGDFLEMASDGRLVRKWRQPRAAISLPPESGPWYRRP